MAAETIKKSFVGADSERRSFFAVEGTTAPITPALLSERHVVRHDRINIRPFAYSFNEII